MRVASADDPARAGVPVQPVDVLRDQTADDPLDQRVLPELDQVVGPQREAGRWSARDLERAAACHHDNDQFPVFSFAVKLVKTNRSSGKGPVTARFGHGPRRSPQPACSCI